LAKTLNKESYREAVSSMYRVSQLFYDFKCLNMSCISKDVSSTPQLKIPVFLLPNQIALTVKILRTLLIILLALILSINQFQFIKIHFLSISGNAL
jgi:hypothetical protein